jgi:hypothetical protein
MSQEIEVPQQLSEEDQRVAYYADRIFETGYTTFKDTALAGVLENYGQVAEGLAIKLISGSAEFFPKAQVYKTTGTHLAYNSEVLDVVDFDEYQKRVDAGKVDFGKSRVFSAEISVFESGKNPEVKKNIFALVPAPKE